MAGIIILCLVILFIVLISIGDLIYSSCKRKDKGIKYYDNLLNIHKTEIDINKFEE
jgi:hypothetical protein